MKKTYADFIAEAENICGVSHNSRLWTDCFQVIGALAAQLEQQEEELTELRAIKKDFEVFGEYIRNLPIKHNMERRKRI